MGRLITRLEFKFQISSMENAKSQLPSTTTSSRPFLNHFPTIPRCATPATLLNQLLTAPSPTSPWVDIFLWLFSLTLLTPHSGGGRIILQGSASMCGWESQPISYKFHCSRFPHSNPSRSADLMPPGTFDISLCRTLIGILPGEGLIIHHIHPMYISALL
ncbi:hypothetical protein DFH07DRAFT_799503 [Mycena maculata]|uniref:Uncharacterized protein n=1 Tax=Mycena maculata TaxID=230809 RepID=A0AAD7NUM1_9AGAR|nr:hypothetical protein DFH07DRAFT_799503 [Mycena maculata]